MKLIIALNSITLPFIIEFFEFSLINILLGKLIIYYVYVCMYLSVLFNDFLYNKL